MTEAIIVALITGAVSVICQAMITSAGRKKDSITNAKREQKIDDRLDAIEHKLDIHNGYAEKFGEIATDMAIMKTEIKNLGGKK